MATRMQQRRGTSSQWTSADPILAAGEIGFETDTGEFRVGDGINVWSDLPPFKNIVDLGGNLDDYIPLTQRGEALGVATLDQDGKVPYTQIPSIDELSQDAVNAALVAGDGISKTYNDPGNTITIAINSDVATKTYADSAVSTHNSDTTNVHGITDTANLVYTDDARLTNSRVPSDLSVISGKIATDAVTTTKIIDGAITSAKIADATIVDGDISATAAIAATKISGTAVTQADTGTVTSAMILNGTIVDADINETAAIAKTKISGTAITAADSGTVTSAMIADGAIVDGDINSAAGIAKTKISGTAITAADTGTVTSTMIADGTIVNADINASAAIAQSKIANLTTDLAAKAPLAGPTFTGTVNAADLTLSGNLTVAGTTTTVSSANLELTDSLIYLSAQQYDTDAVDIGIYGAYGDSNPGHFHTGLVRDASDGGKWKLISGGAEPTSNVVDFVGTTKDTLVIGALDATSATIGNVSNTELQYLDGVTSAIQTQIDAKAPIASPTFTGTVSGITKTMVGLGNVDNTSDANKPISTATQTALDLKAALAGPTFTGTVVLPSTTSIGNVSATEIGYVDGVTSAIQTQLDAKAVYPSQTGNSGKVLTTSGTATSWATLDSLSASYETTVASNGTKTLTATSARNQFFTGNATTQTISLPDTSTIPVGTIFTIYNLSTYLDTPVVTSTSVAVTSVPWAGKTRFICISTANNTAASWVYMQEGTTAVNGSGPAILRYSPNIQTPVIYTPAISYGTINNSLVNSLREVTVFSNSAAAPSIDYAASAYSDMYYSGNATNNVTINFVAVTGGTLDSMMSANQTMTFVFRMANGSTTYYPNVIKIDGTTVTPKWLGGTAPSAGNANAVDVYSFVITKTAPATFVVLASVSKFA